MDILREWYLDLRPDFVVEIQPDTGEVAQALRPSHPGFWFGVESWTPSINEGNLWGLYDRVILSDVRHLDYNTIDPFPDLVILRDVVSHLQRDEATVVVNKIKLWASDVILTVPRDGSRHEPYRGDWTKIHRFDPSFDEVTDILGSGLVKAVAGDQESYFLWSSYSDRV